jgi:hypothetical protein
MQGDAGHPGKKGAGQEKNDRENGGQGGGKALRVADQKKYIYKKAFAFSYTFLEAQLN